MKAIDAVWKAMGFVSLALVLLVPFFAFAVFGWLVFSVLCAYEAVYGKDLYPKTPQWFRSKSVGWGV